MDILAGQYRIDDEIGRGGMAIVYRAWDTRHDRAVAVKTLMPEVSLALGAERFLREVRLAARLNHPHIVPVHDSGDAGGLLYYVMPLIEGRTLREHMQRVGQMPSEDVFRLAGQIAGALDYAHRLGIVHRDIKPENIMLHEGEALITDFGIARALSSVGDAALTQTGIALGTPAYMSPEQAAGEVNIDGRSDQYSLACLVYEMLTGEPLFSAGSAQALIAKRFSAKPPSVRVTVPAVSDSQANAISRALSLEPGERFTTAGEFASALNARSSEKGQDKPSIAVLPFTNLSADPENEFFSDDVTGEIINALGKVQGLQVVSRRSAFAFKEQDTDVRSIGVKLGVSNILEGTVRRSGNRLRVTAELIDVETGYHRWSDRFDREMSDIFAIQDEIAANIVKALSVVLSEREEVAIRSTTTSSIRAYEYYLRGRQLFKSFRRESYDASEDAFRRAIALDPNYALAYTGLAEVSAYRHLYFSGAEEAVEQADSASRKAVELEPGLAEAHAARGIALSCRNLLAEAEAEFRSAMALDPTLFEAPYMYARLHHIRGNAELAVQYYEQAAKLNPDDYQALGMASGLYLGTGRTEEARDAAERGILAAQRALALEPGDVRALYLSANMLLRIGQREKAEMFADRAVEIAPGDLALLYNVGCFYALAGRKEKALESLERAAEKGWNRPDWARHDLDLVSLRGEERFERLLGKMDAAAVTAPLAH